MSERIRKRVRGRMASYSRRCRLSALQLMCLFYILSMSSFSCDFSNGGAISSCNGSLFGTSSVFVYASSDTEDGSENATRSSLRKSSAVLVEEGLTMNQLLIRAGKSGLGGGIPGALAGMVQVFTLMWLRTIINYQCRYGTTFSQALVTLIKDGGIRRLYSGLSFALIQAPLSRFVSTAVNDGVETLFSSIQATKDWGPGRTTVVASIIVGVWRMFLMRKSNEHTRKTHTS